MCVTLGTSDPGVVRGDFLTFGISIGRGLPKCLLRKAGTQAGDCTSAVARDVITCSQAGSLANQR